MLSHLFADDDAVDPHLQRIKNAADGEDSDEEDEDFVADKDDGGSPSDDSEEEESDASESIGEKERPAKKEPKKEVTGTKAPSSKKKSKGGDDEGSKKKQQKKKKDLNAPKRAMSGFMFFANAERENLKKSNPGMSFTDVGRALGEKWNKLTAEEKEPYDSMARADSKCYKEAIAGYRNRCSAMNIDSGGGSDSKYPIP